MAPVTPAGALIGRDNEIALLSGLIREVSRGRGGCLLIEGEPGIGKTALVRTAAAEAPDTACQLLWCTGDELGQELPLSPLLDGLQVRRPSANPRRTTIAQLLRGEIGTDRGADVTSVLAEQLLALVAEECAVRPVILVIDDLQWADQASIALLGRLARSTRDTPLLLIGTMRPIPKRADLLALRRAVGDSNRLQLSGLATTAVVDLIATLAEGEPAGNLLRLAEDAAGNPLYITEIVAASTRGTNAAHNGSGPTASSLPGSLSAAISDRLDFVTDEVRQVLRAAALLGVDFSVNDLAVVLGRRAIDLMSSVDEARAVGVLTESGNGLGFRHPLIRAALYDEMSPPVRAAWHRDAGRALAEADATPDRVARQMLRAFTGPDGASEPMDEWTLSWLARVADPLVGQAPGVATELLTRAVASSPPVSARSDWFASRLAEALYRAGDTEQAQQVAIRTLDHAIEPDVLVDLHRTLAQCRILAGLAEESLVTLDQALALPHLSARHRARLLVLAARTHIILGDAEEAGRVSDHALESAVEADDNWAAGWALHVLTQVAMAEGRPGDALPLFDRALTATQADPALTDLRLLLQINKAVTLGNLDRYEEALTTARQAQWLADQVGTPIRLAQAQGALAQLLFYAGQWDDALTEVAVVPENVKEPAAACNELGIASVISFHRGEVDAAHRYLSAAAPNSKRIGHRLIGPLSLARSREHEYDGAIAEALGVLTDAFANSEDLDEMESLFPDAVRLAVVAGDLETAQALTSEVTELAAGTELPHRLGNALYCRGLLDHDAALLLQAAERYADATRPLPKAQALEAAAHELMRADDRTQARTAFNEAVDAYASLGAAADIARLQAVFRQQGIRRGPHSKHRKAQSGWDSLTPTEIKVAAFVEEGLSNPEIAAKLLLSRRTVGTHVSHILKKLNVATRTDIARESALRRGARR